MDFCEKLSTLLSLTAAKNSELADYLGVGRPYISRMKTGERKMPSNPQIARGMAEFFAKRCGDDYRRSALYEFTSDPRLHAYATESALADVLFEWLTRSGRQTTDPTGHFLSSFGVFSPDDIGGNAPLRGGRIPASGGAAVYFGNEGKRQALRDMVTYVDGLETPCTIRLFTDETYDWLVDDAALSRDLNTILSRQAARKYSFIRIQPPFNNVEFAFEAIERWLPGYMAGAIQQYHYPWARDELHRRTLFVVPGHIALYSNSTFGERESMMTNLSRDPDVVDACSREYEAILKRCRPTMSTFTADQPEHLFGEAEAVAAIRDVGVYKTSGLSVNTLPAEITERIRSRGTEFARRMCVSFERRGKSRIDVLREHVITDIMCLPKLEDVLAGREMIPGTLPMPLGGMRYTPEEYRAHLERILWYLETFPNYQAVFMDTPVHNDVIVYVKGTSRALIVKQSEPFAVFDIQESSMAAAFCAYLRRIAEDRMRRGARQATIKLLHNEIRRIDDVLRKDG